jgi:hypothetical protein
MLNWRNTLPDLEDAGDFAMDQLRSAAKSARNASSQIESWASDGYDAIRKNDAAFWGAVSVGMGALMGGLFALWRSSGTKPRRGRRARTVAAISAMGSRGSRSMRSKGTGMGKRSRKTTRARRKKASA